MDNNISAFSIEKNPRPFSRKRGSALLFDERKMKEEREERLKKEREKKNKRDR